MDSDTNWKTYLLSELAHPRTVREDVPLVDDDTAPVHAPQRSIVGIGGVAEARYRHEDQVERRHFLRRAEFVLGRAEDEHAQLVLLDVLVDFVLPLSHQVGRDDDERGRRNDDLERLESALATLATLPLLGARENAIKRRRILQRVEEALRKRELALGLVVVRVADCDGRRLDVMDHERAERREGQVGSFCVFLRLPKQRILVLFHLALVELDAGQQVGHARFQPFGFITA